MKLANMRSSLISVFRYMLSLVRKYHYRKHSRIGSKVYVSKNSSIGVNCTIKSNVVIGDAVVLGRNVLIGSFVRLERIDVGNNSQLDSRLLITGFGSGKITIGHDSYIGPDTALDFSNDISIGDYVHVAGLSTGLWTHSSARMCLNGLPISDKSELYRPTARICIGNNVYIGGNCTIYPGVRIGHHSVVAPNSAVTKDVEPYSMVGGVPARYIKSTKDMIDNIDDKSSNS